MLGRSFALAVLGDGPAGMMDALCAARRSDVALVVDRIPQDELQCIDAVPVRALAARVDGAFCGDGWPARRLIDATGRAAATADCVVRAERPWGAREPLIDL
jgi:hypothetical protein